MLAAGEGNPRLGVGGRVCFGFLPHCGLLLLPVPVVCVSPAAVAAVALGTMPCLRWQPHCHGSCAPVVRLRQRRARSMVSTSPRERDGDGSRAGQSPCGLAGGWVRPRCFREQIKAVRELPPGCRCEHPALTCSPAELLQPSCQLLWLGSQITSLAPRT